MVAPVGVSRSRQSVVRPTDGLGFGGGHNAEQWHPDGWREDIRLMGEAGMSIVGSHPAARHLAEEGTVLVTYPSGIVERTNEVIPGGYPGASRDLLGAWSEEFRPLRIGEVIELDDGSAVEDRTEDTVPASAEPVIRYRDGDGAGRAAVTRRESGGGAAWKVVRRRTDAGDVLFLINHTAHDVPRPVTGVDPLTGDTSGTSTLVPAGQVVAVQEAEHA